MKFSRLRRVILGTMCTLSLTLVMTGCDSDRVNTVKASGVVTKQGAPVGSVNVVLESSNGLNPAGITGTDGKFVLSTDGKPGATPGSYKVRISPESSGDVPMPGMDGYDAYQKSLVKISKKYQSTETSGLTAEISDSGPNELTFDLKD